MKTAVHVPDAPTPVGPYVQAQAVRLHGGNKLVFTAGQVALDPKSGKLTGEGVGEQTAQVLRNLAAVLAGAGPTPRRPTGESCPWVAATPWCSRWSSPPGSSTILTPPPGARRPPRSGTSARGAKRRPPRGRCWACRPPRSAPT